PVRRKSRTQRRLSRGCVPSDHGTASLDAGLGTNSAAIGGDHGANRVTWKSGATFLAVVALIAARNRGAPSVALLVVTTLLFLTGVISTTDALAGFANQATFTVAALYVVARAIERTGALTDLVGIVMGKSRSWRWELVRLLGASAFVSAFLNNTPVVAM